MTQTYTDPVALKRMTGGFCPECGNAPSSHNGNLSCSLTETGVIDRLHHYRAGPTYGFEQDRREALNLAVHTLNLRDQVKLSGGGEIRLALAQEVVLLRAALDEIDELNPEDYLAPAHVSRAFRKPDMAMAFKEVCRIVNKVLHNTDAYGNPLLPDGTPGG